MADHKTYRKYKRDHRHLVYWIVNTSAGIIQKLPSEPPTVINTTGVVSLTTLHSLSALIAEHLHPIPTTIFRLFESIIEARQERHELFLKIARSNGDPEIKKKNLSHKHWIDGLTEAIHALGGDSWQAGKTPRRHVLDEEQLIFANQFAALNMHNEAKSEDEAGTSKAGSESEDIDAAAQARAGTSTKKPNRKPHKNGKADKRGKRGKKRNSEKKTTDATMLRSCKRCTTKSRWDL